MQNNGTDMLFELGCKNCVLTNCLPVLLPSLHTGPVTIFLTMQPPYLLLPVEIEGPWYANYGYQFAVEMQLQLKRLKRFLGLLIAGIAALVALIATAATASVALSQGVQTARYVNHLAKNVSYVVSTEERIDQKILGRLDGLEEAVEFLGNQLSLLKNQMSLVCHGGFQHICVTPMKTTNVTRGQVRKHLQGIWLHSNMSLDLLELQKEISIISHSQRGMTNPAEMVAHILDGLRGFNPGNLLRYSFWMFIIIFTIVIILLFAWCVGQGKTTQIQHGCSITFPQSENKKGGNVGGHGLAGVTKPNQARTCIPHSLKRLESPKGK
nr:endogenous retrovirus group K member 13-1 Env polyprotein-like [Nyctereutes procyonoides]XP_055169715.1 endogenous retrovirus group K member 13-1 Env polyprotein-like [Nyctereutes procyonoides]XP_055169716.1 endogenous retrovirus group K member 13-1 Env polyprotein-like [Nyctereutes procyonoides]XP_055169717.1 endogenous retrovirus group K member 13-1 Env polyprotein-like [Nyctereutes procyonoides]XP_055169718.1 endogenous retrovirus group K member 13-1 Env polyprotein-like [Nyctereutes proc